MKILYLLFAVFFLVAQSTEGFSHRNLTPRECRRRGGNCFSNCPSGFRKIGNCIRLGKCCRK